MLCVHTLQTPVLFHFSLGAISLALTVHFMTSTMIFGYKAAKRFWGFFVSPDLLHSPPLPYILEV